MGNGEEFHHHEGPEDDILYSLHQLHEKVNALADALADAFAALHQSVTDLQTAEVVAQYELAALAAQIASIQPRTALTADQSTSLTSTVQSVAAALQTAISGAEPAPADPV